MALARLYLGFAAAGFNLALIALWLSFVITGQHTYTRCDNRYKIMCILLLSFSIYLWFGIEREAVKVLACRVDHGQPSRLC